MNINIKITCYLFLISSGVYFFNYLYELKFKVHSFGDTFAFIVSSIVLVFCVYILFFSSYNKYLSKVLE